jgi:hypothetical protein
MLIIEALDYSMCVLDKYSLDSILCNSVMDTPALFSQGPCRALIQYAAYHIVSRYIAESAVGRSAVRHQPSW